MITQPGAAEQLVSKSPVNFDDARVRVYTEDEIDKNRSILHLGTRITGLNHLLKSFAENEGLSDSAVVIEIGTKGVSKMGGDTFTSALRTEIADLKTKRQGLLPRWWKDWEAKARES